MVLKTMNLQWDPKVGPAAIIGMIGSLTALIAIGIAWGTTTTRLDMVITTANDAKLAATEIKHESDKRDSRIASQAERLAKIESAVTFIVPTLQEIGRKLDNIAAKP